MKKSILILFFLASFFAAKNVNAQANVTATGISIQGIARDENNSALANIDQLGLTFRVYYLDGSNNEVQIMSQTANVRTDNFGVFSYVLTIESNQFIMISNTPAYLKITQGSVVFSNEKLQAVPYAIHAQNGVPTGTIMAYIGTTAPAGWLMCDGGSFPDNVYYAQLKTLLGGLLTTPNLSARYLRGTGTVSGREAIALRGTQDDSFKPHNHVVNLNTFGAGGHSHETYFYNDDYNNGGGSTYRGLNRDANENNTTLKTYNTSAVANHEHGISGNTGDSGNATVNETRVFSYGVNWIIKI
jgi:microcystin-dependent protein